MLVVVVPQGVLAVSKGGMQEQILDLVVEDLVANRMNR